MSKHFTCALGLAVIMSASALAQNATQPGQQPRQQPGQPAVQARPGAAVQQTGGQAGNLDQAIAACLALGNQEEIALAQFAGGKAKHDRVKEFAQMMQRDHTAALQKLHQIAPQLASLNLELQAGAAGQTGVQQAGAQPQQGQSGQERFGANQQGVQPAASTQPVNAAAGGADAQMLALQRTIAQECLTLTKRELEEAGEDFDMCYIGQQVSAHVGMLAKLQGSEQFASGELRGFIQEAQQKVETHLTHAKEIAKELKKDSDSANQSAQRSGEARR